MDLHYMHCLYSLRHKCGFPSQCLDVSILPCFSACRRYVFGGRSLQILHYLRVVCSFVPHQGHAPEKSKICRRRLRRKLPVDNSLSALPNGWRQSITPPLRSLVLLLGDAGREDKKEELNSLSPTLRRYMMCSWGGNDVSKQQ